MSSANQHHHRHRRTSRASRGVRTAKTPTPEPAASEIEAKTTELMREFFNHARDYREQYPGDHDPRTIYESWAIQNIAARRYTVLHLADAVAELQACVRRQ